MSKVQTSYLKRRFLIALAIEKYACNSIMYQIYIYMSTIIFSLLTALINVITSLSLKLLILFLCQLTCQSADIMSSLCGVGVRVRVRVRVNNFFSKTTRPRDVLFFLKDTLSIEDEKLFKACKSVCSSVC